MEKEEIFLEMEKILDDWDPLGVLEEFKPIKYEKGIHGEYTRYVANIIESFLLNESIYDNLIKLYSSFRDNPDKENKDEIKVVSIKITNFLNKYDKEELKKTCSG